MTRESKRNTTMFKIWEYVRNNPGVTKYDAANALSMPELKVGNHLSTMKGDGMLRSVLGRRRVASYTATTDTWEEAFSLPRQEGGRLHNVNAKHQTESRERLRLELETHSIGGAHPTLQGKSKPELRQIFEAIRPLFETK